MMDFSIQQEKVTQAVALLGELKIDIWLTFVRETSHNADPALGLITPLDLTWQAALIISRTGQKVAIVGRYDTENVKRTGAFDQVIGYDQSIQPELLRILELIGPRQIAVNYSESDSAADGLSHGMYLTLARYLQGKPYELVSAEKLLNTLRGRKSATEIARIKKAVETTEEIIGGVTAMLKPGLSELDIANYIHGEFQRRGVDSAWEWEYCPIVNCGPDSPVGHAGPSSQFVTRPGQLVHIDMGVTENDYVSDMQRLWYLAPKGESIPEPIQRAFGTVRAAIEAAVKILKPGIRGWEVDAAARKTLTDAGYPEYQHALGHHIGRTTHDGGTLLGPRWERYGKTPEGLVEAGNVYTIEPSLFLPGYGMIAVEEDVLVTDDGLQWLGKPQTEITIVPV